MFQSCGRMCVCECMTSPHSPARWRADKLHNHQQNNKPLRTKCLVWLNLQFSSVSMYQDSSDRSENTSRAGNILKFFCKIYLSNITYARLYQHRFGPRHRITLQLIFKQQSAFMQQFNKLKIYIEYLDIKHINGSRFLY